MTGHPEAEPTLFPTAPRIIVSRCQGLESLSFALKLRDAYREVVAEGWAWRCADTIPDSAQSRLDSMADADCLLAALSTYGRVSISYPSTSAQQCMAFWLENHGKEHARISAHTAFQACPALRS